MIEKVLRVRYIVFLIVFLTAFSVNAQKSKAKAQFISLDRSSIAFKGDKNGYNFEKVKFKYQFVTCKGEVVLGVAYDKDAVFTKYWKDGKSYAKSEIGAKWPKPQDIRINDVVADLYFGSRKLGVVKIIYIPERYTGCSGTTHNILKSIGINSKDRLYKTNINKLNLRNIKVERASIKS